MLNANVTVSDCLHLKSNYHLLKLSAPEIASIIRPGQFFNVKVSETIFPLLRRPFSICDVEGDIISIMFNKIGAGTGLLSNLKKGDSLDVIGPLGNGFPKSYNKNKFVIIAGGIGVAPFTFLTKELLRFGSVTTYLGGRTMNDIVTYGLQNVHIATDDGSTGFKGNVLELFNSDFDENKLKEITVLACGPSQMLKAVYELSVKSFFDCFLSVESSMACGFGICQGCPVDSSHQQEKYLLICKDGPIFNSMDIIL